ncbi:MULTISPECIES: peptidase [unclassified Saccharothrix]|uniref:peptidase n=1 Tax=unclassified Saccharothrix TaxID=2593673 RepID=UPI00307E40E8
MFRADPELGRVVDRALRLARDLDHPRTGSEHLLLALTSLTGHHDAIREAVDQAAPQGAGAAADRVALKTLGIDFDQLVAGVRLDRPPAREPLFPLGAAKARARCARLDPPLGLDAQAAYEASLRFALARRERRHRPEHLALVLVALDPGVAWVLDTARVDRTALVHDLARRFPPPRRNPVLRWERRLGSAIRHRDLVTRYQRTTGRTATSSVAAFITD